MHTVDQLELSGTSTTAVTDQDGPVEAAATVADHPIAYRPSSTLQELRRMLDASMFAQFDVARDRHTQLNLEDALLKEPHVIDHAAADS